MNHPTANERFWARIQTSSCVALHSSVSASVTVVPWRATFDPKMVPTVVTWHWILVPILVPYSSHRSASICTELGQKGAGEDRARNATSSELLGA